MGIFFAVGGVLMAQKTQSDSGYLQSVGPPALRFQKNFPANPLILALLFPARTNFVSDAKSAVAETALVSSNIASVSDNISVSPTNANATAKFLPSVENNSFTSTNFAAISSSASDLLTVTPQMLIEYLKPASETNQMEIVAPAEIKFTPPTPAVLPESRATYKN